MSPAVPDRLAPYASTPNLLAPHYTQFRVAERLLLSGHSHQAWPDVAAEGQMEAFADAADAVDAKWGRASAKADVVREGYRGWLEDSEGEIALAESTHALVVRFLSCLDLRRRPRLVTTDGEFHSLRRQLTRLAEEGVEVIWVQADPVGTLAERLAASLDDRTSAVLVSSVLFGTSQIVPHLGPLAAACRQRDVELLVDAYHALGPVPFPLHQLGLASAWVTGGGYKYLQLGEGNAFLRLPPHAADARPVVTGWFAEFAALTEQPGQGVSYPRGGDRFAGATYDPTSHYRAARVVEFFGQQRLTPSLLRQLYQHQLAVLAERFDELGVPDGVITRDRDASLSDLGGFLALRSTYAGQLQRTLAERGVLTDSRGDILRFGPAPYLTDAQLETAVGVLGEVLEPLV